VDFALALLVGGTAIFAAAVAYFVTLRDRDRQRAGLAAAAAAGAVTAGFLLMLGLAAVSVPATVGLVALVTGPVAYLVVARDLGRRRAALAAAGTTAVVTASFLVVFYLAVLAFVAAAGVYLLVRTRLKVNAALVLMSTTLSGLLAAAALAFWFSLTYAM
jgi:hypothetical protein